MPALATRRHRIMGKGPRVIATGWDAPQIAVLIAAFIGAGGATLAGWWVSTGQARADRALAIRQSRVDAYREILRSCYHLADWCQRTLPLWSEGGEPEPTLPEIEQQREARMLAALHGPPAVSTALMSFLSAVEVFWADALELIRDRTGRDDLASVRKGLPDRRKVINDRLTELAELMSTQVTEQRGAD